MSTQTDTDFRMLAATSLKAVPTGLLINGSWKHATGSARFEVQKPATGEPLANVVDATLADAQAALDAAVDAQPEWAAWSARRRSEILRVAYERMIVEIDTYAALITLEKGKSLIEARGEVRYAAEFLRWFSEEAVRLGGHA